MIQLAIWVPSHVIILFWGIAFPFHYRAFERRGRLKYIHITEVVVALILPSVPVGIALGTGGYIYDGIPPLVCLPKNVAVEFYAFLLPSAVLMVTGGTFLVLIVWKLIKVRHCPTFAFWSPYVFNLSFSLFLSRSILENISSL